MEVVIKFSITRQQWQSPSNLHIRGEKSCLLSRIYFTYYKNVVVYLGMDAYGCYDLKIKFRATRNMVSKSKIRYKWILASRRKPLNQGLCMYDLWVNSRLWIGAWNLEIKLLSQGFPSKFYFSLFLFSRNKTLVSQKSLAILNTISLPADLHLTQTVVLVWNHLHFHLSPRISQKMQWPCANPLPWMEMLKKSPTMNLTWWPVCYIHRLKSIHCKIAVLRFITRH